eukprot:12926644-Prorocentrum_lima.AAC.1
MDGGLEKAAWSAWCLWDARGSRRTWNDAARQELSWRSRCGLLDFRLALGVAGRRWALFMHVVAMVTLRTA